MSEAHEQVLVETGIHEGSVRSCEQRWGYSWAHGLLHYTDYCTTPSQVRTAEGKTARTGRERERRLQEEENEGLLYKMT